jgi:hypothetical protein
MFAARLNRTVVCHDDQRIRPEHRTPALRRPAQATWPALAIAGACGAVGALAPVGIAFPAVAVIAAATLVGMR